MRRALPLVSLLLLGACESSPQTSHDLGGNRDLLAAAYPAGPYGNTVGATMPPLEWIGYSVPNGDALATTAPYAEYSMDDLRRSGRAYAVVHVSAFF